MIDVIVDIPEEAVYELLNDPEGLVGELVAELSERAAVVARAAVHVRPGTPRSTVWSNRSTARPPGFTRASISPHIAIGAFGLYGGVNASADPAIFLEYPASQMYDKYPFLTTALDSLEL